MQGTRLILDSVIDSTLIWQKGESQNKCVSGGEKCSFFGKFGVLFFLETPGISGGKKCYFFIFLIYET